MLMIVSESLGKTRTLIEVARELSLNLSYFGSAAALDRLMGGHSRRFVLLTEDDISAEMLVSLDDASAHVRLRTLVCRRSRGLPRHSIGDRRLEVGVGVRQDRRERR